MKQYDWDLMEYQAIVAGETSPELIQSDEGRKLLSDLAKGYRTYLPTKCSASEHTWSGLKSARVSGVEHCRVNGLRLVRVRHAKAIKYRQNMGIMDRLSNPLDPCEDLVGDGSGTRMIDHLELFDRAKSKLLPTERFRTPWRAVSAMVREFARGDVIILCGLSGTGKTNIAMQMTVFSGHRTLYFGVDMSTAGFGVRMWKTAWYRDNNGQPFADYRTECNKAFQYGVDHGINLIPDNVRTYDGERMTIEEIERITMLEMETFQPTVIVIDYAGRIESASKAADQWRIDQEIARSVKMLAKRCNVRIIALCQFNSTAKKYIKPEFSWLSGSKELISACDTVLCCWNDSRQGDNGQPETDPSHIWISDDIKNRDAGCHGNTRLEAYGLWLTEET